MDVVPPVCIINGAVASSTMQFSKVFLIILSVSGTISKRPTCTFDPFCFYYTNGCTLTGCSPYKTFPNITCDDCVNKCLADQDTSEGFGDFLVMTTVAGGTTPTGLYCKSIVYDCETQTCKMFCDDDTGSGKLAVESRSIYLRYSIENCPYTATPVSTVPTVGPTDSCPPGQTAKIIEIDDHLYHPGFSTDHQFGVPDQHDCAIHCLQNMLGDGTHFDCHSAEFHNGQCSLSSSMIDAENSDNLDSDTAGALYEKFCFDSSLVANCDDIMQEHPHKVLVGLNKQTLDAASIQDCFFHCLNSQKEFGFMCNSGLFFPAANTQNCILNVETKDTRPDLFIDFASDKVTYFSPKCHGGVFTGGGAGAGPPGLAILRQHANIIRPSQHKLEKRPELSTNTSTTQRPTVTVTIDQSSNDANLLFGGQDELRKADSPVRSSSACRAIVGKNGVKNCIMGVRLVDGVRRYCSQPVDC